MENIRGIGGLSVPGIDQASPSGGAGSAPASGFADTLKHVIAEVNDAQNQANLAVSQMLTGENQNIHQTMIAMQKAEISFQLMMEVRNKIVNAYEEIQRMQV